MDRRDFLKRGAALAAVTASVDAIPGFPLHQEAHGASVAAPLHDYGSESSRVTGEELKTTQQWHEAVTMQGSRQPQSGEWLEEWLGTGPPFSFRYGGEPSGPLLAKWRFHREEIQGDPYSDQSKLVWRDPAGGLEAEWQVKRFTDFPAIEWLLRFKNAGTGDTLLLEEIRDLDLQLTRTTEDQPFILHGAHGGRYKRDDWWPFSRYLPSAVSEGMPEYENGMGYNLGSDYPSSRRHLPFFNLEHPESRGVIVGVGWTGDWAGHFEVDKKRLTARVGLKETHFVLHPGEQVRTARILVLLWKGRFLHGQNMLRRLLHEHYIPLLNGKPREPLLSVNTCFTHHGKGAFLEEANEKTLAPEVQPFIQMGAEAFIIDAGWNGNKSWPACEGNWTYSREKYPNGFTSISAPLEAADVAFGIWFAPEVVNEEVPLLREHPEWTRPSDPGGYIEAGGRVLRMELPETREWFLNQVEELIEKQGMTLYRQDGVNHESDLREGEPDNRKGIREIQYITGLYAMQDELKRRHPQLIMEAALGAPRIDLETISRFHWHQPCESWLHPALDQCQTYGMGLWMPGGSLVFYNDSMDNYGLWSGYGGQLSVAWEPSDPGFPSDWARRQIQLYKHIRPFLGGDFYPLTPLSMDERWMGYQFHHPDGNSGCAFIFKRLKSPQVMYLESDAFTLRLNGLSPISRYSIRYESSKKDAILTGAELAKGVEIDLGAAPTAELAIYQALS